LAVFFFVELLRLTANFFAAAFFTTFLGAFFLAALRLAGEAFLAAATLPRARSRAGFAVLDLARVLAGGVSGVGDGSCAGTALGGWSVADAPATD
jgi:hypothetical protein